MDAAFSPALLRTFSTSRNRPPRGTASIFGREKAQAKGLRPRLKASSQAFEVAVAAPDLPARAVAARTST
eukprot:7133237-Alexandrium_andersonii.AAC.1